MYKIVESLVYNTLYMIKWHPNECMLTRQLLVFSLNVGLILVIRDHLLRSSLGFGHFIEYPQKKPN